jgi:hypothetical protein
MRRHIGVRRVGVLAIRGALPRLRGRRGGGARGRIGVPKGLNDRSDSTEPAEVQAIHRLQWVSKKPRPVSFSLIYASTLGIGRNHAS